MQITKRADKVQLNDKIILPDGSLAHITMIESDDNTVCFRWFENNSVLSSQYREKMMFKNKFDIVYIMIGH